MKKIESWIDAFLSRSPAQPLFLRKAAKTLLVLAYHGIDDPAQFEQHLQYILESKMHPISLEEFLDALNGGKGLPEKAVLITFDDGDRSILEKGMPVLHRYAMPAVAFVIAGHLDGSMPFWWNEVKELVKNGSKIPGYHYTTPEELVRILKKETDERRVLAIKELRRNSPRAASPCSQLRIEELPALESLGIAIGNHSLTHPCFPRCPDDKIQKEIHNSHEILQTALKHHPQVFAFPNGEADDRAVKTYHMLGYKAGFLFDHRINLWPVADNFHISRLRINSHTSLDRFRIILSGLHSALHHLRGLR